MKLFSFILLFCFAMVACTKKESFDPGTFYAKHEAGRYDSSQHVSKLIGTWQFSGNFCNNSASPILRTGIKVSFNANGNFELIDSDGVLASGTWRIKPAGTNNWQLELSQTSDYLVGRILFNDNKVMFNGTYTGPGCDAVFFQ